MFVFSQFLKRSRFLFNNRNRQLILPSSSVICNHLSASAYRIPIQDLKESNFIFVDTETAGLPNKKQIIQLAAITNQTQSTCIDVYCHPSKETIKALSQSSKFKFRRNKLYCEDEEKPTFPVKEALIRLIHLAIAMDREEFKCVLVAHNAPVDAKLIVTAAIENELIEEFSRHFVGFVDTLSIFKKMAKDFPFFPQIKSFRQQDLVAFFLNGDYQAHNARNDVHLLKNLYQEAISPLVINELQDLSDSSFSVDYFTDKYFQQEQIQNYLNSFDHLIKSKALKKKDATKLAVSGIGLDQLKELLVVGGEAAVASLFLTKLGKMRYGSYNKIIDFIRKILYLD